MPARDAEFGSDLEWASLSAEEQHEAWAEFHALCAQGMADSLYFYEVLMRKHLVGYVGH